MLAVSGLALWAWWRQPVPVRGRVLVFCAPILAMALVVPYGYGGFMSSSQRNPYHPNALLWFQWIILVAVPALAFAVATLGLHRWERVHHLVRLGREAEQREVALGR